MSNFIKRLKVVFILCNAFFIQTAFAYDEQDDAIRSFLLYNNCDFDTSQIVVLSDKVDVSFNSAFTLVQERKIYIKFLKSTKSGYFEAIYLKDLVKNVENGIPIFELINLDQDNYIVAKDITSKIKNQEFNIFNQGALLYINYKSTHPYNGRMPVFFIQSNLPAEQVQFKITYPELVEIDIKKPIKILADVDNTRNYSAEFKTDIGLTRMKHFDRVIQYSKVPVYHQEVYSDFYLDNFHAIRISISKLKRDVKQKNPEIIRNDNGQSLFMDLSSRADFMLKFNEKFELPKEYHNKILSLRDRETKLARIFDLVRRHFYARSYDTLFLTKSNQSFNSLWSQRVATPTEINFMLIKVLQIYGFDAVPLLVSSNNYSKPNINFPVISDFNRVICCVYEGDKTIPLDASLRYGEFPMIAPDVLQRWAFSITIDKPRWIFIDDTKTDYRNQVILLGDIRPQDNLHFLAYVNSFGYSKAERVGVYMRDSLKSVINRYFKTDDVSPYRFIIANEIVDSLPLAQEFEFLQKGELDNNLLNVPANIIGFPPKLFEIYPDRKTAVHFYMKQNYDYLLKFGMPNNYETFVMPSAISLSYFNGDLIFKREVHKLDKSFSIKYNLEINKETFNESETEELGKALQKIKNLMQQEVVLKKLY